MTFDLRQYQADAIQAVREQMRAHKRIMLYSPTGSGKTNCAIEIIKLAVSKKKRVAFICNRIGLVTQASKRFNQSNIPHGIIQGNNTHSIRRDVIICSIKTVVRRKYPLDVDLIVVDEAHGCMAQEYQRFFETYNNIPIIGLSATPFTKGLGKENYWGKTFEKMVCAITIRDLIDQGYLVDCDIYAPSEPDLAGVKIVRGDYDERQLGIAVDKPRLVGDIVQHWRRLANGLPTVCFGTNIAHSKHIMEEFLTEGISAEHIDCFTDDDERAAILRRHNDGITTILCNVSVLSEGWDCLDEKTEILTNHGWRGIGKISLDDRVYSLNKDTEKIECITIENYGERTVHPGEKMVQFLSQHINIRVTEGHEIHIKNGRKADGEFFIKTAGELVEQKSGCFSLPIGGIGINFNGVRLTDDELRFIAWFMTDGGFNGNPFAIAINQSQAKPHYVIEIRNLLTRLGFDFHERIRPPSAFAGAYPNAKPIHEFTIPKGTDHGSKKRNGWNHLKKYLDKNVSPLLHQMSKRQFVVFWEELLKGDGECSSPNKSGWLWCCEKTQADAYTQMAVLRGFSSSYSTRITPNGVIMYRICVRQKKWINIARADLRATKISYSNAIPNEKVWCVKNKNSTIVIRREGKIAIVGNSPKTSCMILARPTRSLTRYIQMVGRALRPYPGKERALVLDHSGTCYRLGFPTDDLPLELDDGTKQECKDTLPQERKPHVCINCHFLIPAGIGACPKCGCVPQRQNKIEHEAGELTKVERKEKYSAEQKQELWSSALGLAEKRKKSTGWASHLYRSLTGVWPRGLHDIPCEPIKKVLDMDIHNRIAYAKSKNKQIQKAV